MSFFGTLHTTQTRQTKMETEIKKINKWKLFCLLKPLVCSLIHHFVCIKRSKLDCTKYCITDLSMKRCTAIKCSEVMADHGYVERGGCSDRQLCFIIIKISAYVSPDPTRPCVKMWRDMTALMQSFDDP